MPGRSTSGPPVSHSDRKSTRAAPRRSGLGVKLEECPGLVHKVRSLEYAPKHRGIVVPGDRSRVGVMLASVQHPVPGEERDHGQEEQLHPPSARGG